MTVDEVGRAIHEANLIVVDPARSPKDRAAAKAKLNRLRGILKNKSK